MKLQFKELKSNTLYKCSVDGYLYRLRDTLEWYSKLNGKWLEVTDVSLYHGKKIFYPYSRGRHAISRTN